MTSFLKPAHILQKSFPSISNKKILQVSATKLTQFSAAVSDSFSPLHFNSTSKNAYSSELFLSSHHQHSKKKRELFLISKKIIHDSLQTSKPAQHMHLAYIFFCSTVSSATTHCEIFVNVNLFNIFKVSDIYFFEIA